MLMPRPRRLPRGRFGVRIAAAAAVLLFVGTAAGAQQRRSPTDDVIEAMKRAVNDLRYAEAIRLGRDIEPFVGQMRPAQAIAFREVFALAFYPEEREYQSADSALRQLDALVRLHPEVELPLELRWAGLDSLLAVARARTFGFSASPAGEYVLTGREATGDVEVYATRAAVVRLALVHRGSGRAIPQDSALVRERGTLRLRAHRDGALLIEPGEYLLRLVAADTRGRDSIVVERRAVATAPAIALQPLPALDSASLRPERVVPDRTGTVVTGALAALATTLVASTVRGGGSIADTFGADPRANAVGGAVLLGALGLAATERGRPIPENIRANEALRAAHATRVTTAQGENARRLAEHRVTLRVTAEDR